MNDILFRILAVYCLIVGATTIGFFIEGDSLDNFVSTPKDLYNSTTFNWFGVVLIYILLVILFPMVFVLKFLHCLFHVGR